jgi:hypothetical protein
MSQLDPYLLDLLHRANVGQNLSHKQLIDIAQHKDVNLVGFDIETTGLQSPLEAPSRTSGSMTEFAIQSGTQEVHGFTKYANIPDYTKAWEGADRNVGVQFKSALQRYIGYEGKSYSATDILHTIGSTFAKDKVNVVTGHNLTAFDWKFLTTHHALESGLITETTLDRFKKYAATNPDSHALSSYFSNNIKPGWEKAQSSALGILKQYDPNVQFLETLGELDPTGKFKSSKFPRPNNLAGPRGMVGTYLQEKFPGLHSFYKEHFMAGGLKEKPANEEAFYAARKGTTVEDWMKFAGMEFKGKAHDPTYDVRNHLAYLKSQEIRGLEDLTQKEASQRFLSHQSSIAGRTINEGKSAGSVKLGLEMKEILSTSPKVPIEPVAEWWKGITKAPLHTKIMIGGAGALLAYAGFRLLTSGFDEPQKQEGLHPGNGGYATGIIRNNTDFGSGYKGLKNTIKTAFDLVSSGEKSVVKVSNPGIIMLEKHLDNPETINELRLQGFSKGHASIKMSPAGVHEGDAWLGLEHDAIKSDYQLGAEPIKKGSKQLLRDSPGTLSDKTGFISKEKVNIGGQRGHIFIPKGQKAKDLFGFDDSPSWAEDLRNAESVTFRNSETEYVKTQRLLNELNATSNTEHGTFHIKMPQVRVPQAPMSVSQTLREQQTAGLVNIVLEQNGRGHHIHQNKAF